METSERPRVDLARAVLPEPLLDAIIRIFEATLPGTALVGGTAISGFYAGHRRSDDLDLFTPDGVSQADTVRAVRRLKETAGAQIEVLHNTSDFYDARFQVRDYSFKVQVVLDEALHEVGAFHYADHNIRVASLDTLFGMKSAALVSRCNEKDLYDIMWLLANGFSSSDYDDLIRRGHIIDQGVTGEAMIMSVTGANLSADACSFALDPKLTSEIIFAQVTSFRDRLAEGISLFMHSATAPALGGIAQGIMRSGTGTGAMQR